MVRAPERGLASSAAGSTDEATIGRSHHGAGPGHDSCVPERDEF